MSAPDNLGENIFPPETYSCPVCSNTMYEQDGAVQCDDCGLEWDTPDWGEPRYMDPSDEPCAATCGHDGSWRAADISEHQHQNPGAHVYAQHNPCPLPEDHGGRHHHQCAVVINRTKEAHHDDHAHREDRPRHARERVRHSVGGRGARLPRHRHAPR